MEDIKKLVGNRIKELRKERGLSQEKLGFKADLHYTHIGAMERGERNWSIDTLVKVAQGLEVSIADLIVFPSPPEEIETLKKSLVKEIDATSPQAVKLVLELLHGIKSLQSHSK